MSPEEMAVVHAAAFTQSRPWRADEFRDLLSNRFTHSIGNGQCFAVFQVVADEAELLTIATHPYHQRQGHARSLMDAWHSQAGKLGAARAFLDVAADNAPAIALYDSCGYAPIGLRRGYYRRPAGENVDAVLMERALP
ncbi:GNAT family N-acetyltransferase [Ruegeria sediminis]|uniref:GNAT family N-acetyltransferase n=1 Tax=Ruegeria sediminis TaxID=2583820 RepID=A0ABY2X490_9RHOB|nr:GNAT family N-acetyltransferase [Ruegeria sediminis]TMV10188.1 GNAT family N-acetyltransferase [Ruegeria sediminis]